MNKDKNLDQDKLYQATVNQRFESLENRINEIADRIDALFDMHYTLEDECIRFYEDYAERIKKLEEKNGSQ